MILFLFVVVLVLYVLFYIGHIWAKKAAAMIPQGPLDPEDRFFTDEFCTRSSRFAFVKSPYDAFSRFTDQVADSGAHEGRSNRSLLCSGTKLVLNTSVQGTAAPPPAYTSPRSTTAPHCHWSSSFSFLNQPPPPREHKRSLTSLPKIKIKKQKRPFISKPISHPEGPLPGPPTLEFESADSFTALLKPCMAPHDMSYKDLHAPTIHLPTPSQAYVHHRYSGDGTNRTGNSSRFLSLSSGVFGQPKLDVSIASSKIGLAF